MGTPKGRAGDCLSGCLSARSDCVKNRVTFVGSFVQEFITILLADGALGRRRLSAAAHSLRPRAHLPMQCSAMRCTECTALNAVLCAVSCA